MASTKRSYDTMAKSHKTCVKIRDNILGGVELNSETKDFLQDLIQRHAPKLRDERSKIEGVDILSPGRFIITELSHVIFNMPVFNQSIRGRWNDIKRAATIFDQMKNELSHLVVPRQSLIRVDTTYLIVEQRLPLGYTSCHEMAYKFNKDKLTPALAQLTKFIIWSGFRYVHPNTVPLLQLEVRPDGQYRIGLMDLGDCGSGTLSSRFFHDKTKKNMKYNKYKKHAFVRKRKFTRGVAKKSSMHLVKEDLNENIQYTLEVAFCRRLIQFVYPQHFDIIYKAALSEGVDLKTMFPSPEGWEQACNDRKLAIENGSLSLQLFSTIELCADINAQYFTGDSWKILQTVRTVRLKLDFDLEIPIRAFRTDCLIGVLFANKDSNVVSIILQSARHLDDAPAVLKSVLSEEGEVITSVKRMSLAEGLCLLVIEHDERLADFVKIHRESGFPITNGWTP
ncbi:hypothetical protein MHUMG1_07502 [Metarhizium humberi]|uniref:Uncharacterized protein n=1 Tax=Metarhizium humberi TaxID=2596975 RepID=A0A9P8M6F7_9HYPO|nr:hypothetical protein MHUMG1_07502 [Metarhizium humberi]